MDPIIITGCARSGTSITACIIELCGSFGGNTQKPNKANPKGMFENLEIRNKIIKPFLKSIKCDPMAQKPLPELNKVYEKLTGDFIENQRNLIYTIIKQQGYVEGSWYIKEPKICLIWPLFVKIFPNAKWIIVRREERDIINSCLRTHFMNKYKKYEGWESWVSIHKKRFVEIILNCDSKEIWPQQIINEDFTEIKSVIRESNLIWKDSEITNFIDKKLWHKTEEI